jgi:hypothetical protein
MTRPNIHALIVAVASLGVLALFTESYWKPPLIAWLTTAPVLIVDCKRVM